ncbi:thioredoxin family protein [Phreatobacter sp.]|uniref:thioredoxin family protein n=1 Tax=Phreatobacter sp. TaxID=1966341 RepID=UPI0025D644A2|nr:thioredoxin family protein [Phreatobacter sp.]
MRWRGCARCSATEEMVRAVADRLGIAVERDRVTDDVAIAGFGISTLGAVIDGKAVHARDPPKLDAIAAWLPARGAPAAEGAGAKRSRAAHSCPARGVRHSRVARATPDRCRPSCSFATVPGSARRSSLRCGPDLRQPVSGQTGTCGHARGRSAGTIAISPCRSERRGISRDARLAAP